MTTSTPAAYGPVELYLLGLPEQTPDPSALAALRDLTDAGILRLLDLVLLSRDAEGDLTVVEAEDLGDVLEIDIAIFGATGLTGDDDIAELATAIEPGTAALLVAVELVYQRELAARTAASGAVLLSYERIPAPVVNALVDSLTLED